MTMSGQTEVSRISAGMAVGGISVALISGSSAYSLSPGWRYFLRPLASILKALSCRLVYVPSLQQRYRASIQYVLDTRPWVITEGALGIWPKSPLSQIQGSGECV